MYKRRIAQTRSGHGELWRLAGPLIISNISIALLGVVDTAVVGHLEHAYYLGAVAVAAIIFDFLYWGMGFLRMGTTGIVAQVHGRNDPDAMRSTLLHASIVAIMIAVLILLLQVPIIEIGLFFIGGSEEVQHYARIYFSWAIWGAPAVLTSMTLFGWLLGMQNARATLYIAVIINVINIIMDFILVFGLDMDVRGVALASVIAEICGLLIAITLVAKELRRYPGKWRWDLIMDLRRILAFLTLNQHIFIRTICLIFVFAFFTRAGAGQGEMILAANALLLNFQAVLALSLDGFANAAEALVGKAIGAADRHAFYRSIKSAVFWSVLFAMGFSFSYLVAGSLLINIMTSIPGLQVAAKEFLLWISISPLISVWCFLLDGIFIGATRGREMRDMMLISTFLIFIPAWYLLQPWGNHGLWLAFMFFFVARGVTLGFVFLRIEKGSGFICSRTRQAGID